MAEEANIPNNAEIDKALKEFEAKSQAEQVKSQAGQPNPTPEATPEVNKNDVGGVKFDLPTYEAMKFYKESSTPKMVNVVMKISHGSIKNQKQAEWILLGFVVVAVGISIYLLITANQVKQVKDTPQMIQAMYGIHPK